jgi:hypothetical protein
MIPTIFIKTPSSNIRENQDPEGINPADPGICKTDEIAVRIS